MYLVPNDSYEKFYLAVKGLITFSLLPSRFELMLNCWKLNKNDRPSFEDLLNYLSPDLSDKFHEASFYFGQPPADASIAGSAVELADDADDLEVIHSQTPLNPSQPPLPHHYHRRSPEKPPVGRSPASPVDETTSSEVKRPAEVSGSPSDGRCTNNCADNSDCRRCPRRTDQPTTTVGNHRRTVGILPPPTDYDETEFNTCNDDNRNGPTTPLRSQDFSPCEILAADNSKESSKGSNCSKKNGILNGHGPYATAAHC